MHLRSTKEPEAPAADGNHRPCYDKALRGGEVCEVDGECSTAALGCAFWSAAAPAAAISTRSINMIIARSFRAGKKILPNFSRSVGTE